MEGLIPQLTSVIKKDAGKKKKKKKDTGNLQFSWRKLLKTTC